MAASTRSKCGIEMRLSFVPEITDPEIYATVWHPGPATPRKGLAGFLSRSRIVEYDKGQVMALEAWRCSSCGRVELFAGRPDDNQEQARR